MNNIDDNNNKIMYGTLSCFTLQTSTHSSLSACFDCLPCPDYFNLYHFNRLCTWVHPISLFLFSSHEPEVVLVCHLNTASQIFWSCSKEGGSISEEPWARIHNSSLKVLKLTDSWSSCVSLRRHIGSRRFISLKTPFLAAFLTVSLHLSMFPKT